MLLGFSESAIIEIGVVLIVLIIIIVILVILYKRYKTNKDYNENPEIFAHKPELTGGEKDNLEYTEIKPFMN